MDDQVDRVRRFNRLVTQRVGALDDHFLGRARPLGASRLLFEIGSGGADLRDLRRRLDLDSGYLSRLVKRLERDGLIRLRPGADDERVREARLTPKGRRELHLMNVRSDEVAQGLLTPLTPAQQARLVTAMDEVHRLLYLAGIRIERVEPASADARWCVAQYFEELDRRFEAGFDPGRSLPAEDADLVPPEGAFLVAIIDGEVVAGGAVKRIARDMGSIKRMWVSETVRGLGIGRRMLEALEQQARELGFRTVRLETNGTLKEAIQLYRTAGYTEVPAFNADPYAQHWFEKRLR
jgi:DNA-binding MarR family transcriptional regulator/N-acetylglutamate synthase-like GNAT family acetyltransferase